MKVIVFGASGMLGTYVTKYLSQSFEVVKINRDELDLQTVNKPKLAYLIANKNISKGDVIINCAGLIKQRNPSSDGMIIINSLFPLQLADICEEWGINMIHITTDCVFSGKEGNYTENSSHDCEDEYGKTKSLGEPKNACVIRTSIIGEENNNKLSLIEWVKSNQSSSINGYTNHLWNGVTCLQLAKILEEIISNNLFWSGVRHIYSNTVNKYELVSIINNIFELNIIVNPIATTKNCIRTLSSVFPLSFDIPSIQEQIQELKEFKI